MSKINKKEECLKNLQKNLCSFLDELIEVFPNETSFVVYNIFVKNQIDKVLIMNHVIEKLLPMKAMITEKNPDFFLKHNILFDILGNRPGVSIIDFKKIWIALEDEDSKQGVWGWFASFVSLAERYRELNT